MMSIQSCARGLLGVLAWLLGATTTAGAPADSLVQCPMVKMVPERLPDMNMPRAFHSVFYAGGELTVTGGHTTGFVPTPTAEYFADGEWHLMTMVYTHDNGLTVPMKSGRVLLGGGHSEAIGIGQTYLTEWYDPTTHTFTGFGCLAQKRSLARGVETDSGHVVIVGNHYHHDAIEVFDGGKQFTQVKEVTVGRACPYLFRTSDGDVVVAGSFDNRNQRHSSTMADRLKGEPFSVPLFEQWHTLVCDYPFDNEACFIGDEAKGDYSYLLTVVNDEGQIAIAVERDAAFALLPTDSRIPMVAFGDSIEFNTRLVADRKARRAYVMGQNRHDRHFLLCVDYSQQPAALTLFYTEPMGDLGNGSPVVTPDGNLLIAGGVTHSHDNFSPLATVWLLRTNGTTAAEIPHSTVSLWLWMALIALVLMAIAFIADRCFTRRQDSSVGETDVVLDAGETTVLPSDEEKLMARIDELMMRQQLFLNGELKLSDVAAQLGSNRNSVSLCINSQRGCSFSQFINTMRIDHAKMLMRKHPDMKISEVWGGSGFTTEATFFRTFKAMTGMTPNEWKQSK